MSEDQEKSESQKKLENMSDEQLYTDIDRFFPIRDNNHKPNYRKYQRQSIFNALKTFQKGIKFVIIDGPVGCGKSVINYTIGRVMGSCVYLTSMKQLQTQIIKEGWDRVKSIMGRNAYLCNYAKNKYGVNISCDYNGEDYKMCLTDKDLSRSTTSHDENMIKLSIIKNLKIHKNNETFRRKFTSFEPHENIDSIFCEIKTQANVSNIKYPIPNLLGCKCSPVECSVRSSRIISKLYDVRVLNPDVFYTIIRFAPEYFGRIPLMILDESHNMETIVQRIWTTKIPLDVIKYMFDIDFKPLLVAKTASEFSIIYNQIKCERAGHLLAAAKVFNNMRDVTRLHSHSNIGDVKSQTEYSVAIHQARETVERTKLTFSILNFINIAFTDKIDEFLTNNHVYNCFKPFMELVRNDFIAQCQKLGVGILEYDFIKEFANPIVARFPQQLGNTYKPVEQANVMDYAIMGVDALEMIFDKVDQMVNFKVGEYHVFIFNFKTEQGCSGTELDSLSKTYQYNGNNTSVEVIPANIGSLLEYGFFKYADHVIMSSGTWPEWKNTIKTYGLDPDKDVRYLKIPSSFPVHNRPIYILDNKSYTNFSEKSDSVEARYVYQTSSGQEKWLKELSAHLVNIRRFVGASLNCNADTLNTVIHTFSFSIARTLAEFGYIDDSWLFHVGHNNDIINKKTNRKVTTGGKDELVDRMLNNPDAGLTLVSPSVSEGVDMKYGSARIQIILKAPIPNAVDPYVVLRSRGNPDINIPRDNDYFLRTTLITLSQQYGRIMRAADDVGFTFMIDQKLTELFRDLLGVHNKNALAKCNIGYVTEAIQYHLDQHGKPVFDWMQ